MLERERLEAEKRRFAEERLDESQNCEGNESGSHEVCHHCSVSDWANTL